MRYKTTETRFRDSLFEPEDLPPRIDCRVRMRMHGLVPMLLLLITSSGLWAATPYCDQRTAIERGTEVKVSLTDAKGVDNARVRLGAEAPLKMDVISGLTGSKTEQGQEQVTIPKGTALVLDNVRGLNADLEVRFGQPGTATLQTDREDVVVPYRKGQWLNGRLLEDDLTLMPLEDLRADLKKNGKGGMQAVLPRGTLLTVDPAKLPSVRLQLLQTIPLFDFFQTAALGIATPLRTPPTSPFTVVMRKAGHDFRDDGFVACAREVDSAGAEFVPIGDVELMGTADSSARLTLTLPPEFDDGSGFEFRWLATPIQLRVFSYETDGGTLVGERRYYVGSPLYSFLLALGVVLFFYLFPLYTLRCNRSADSAPALAVVPGLRPRAGCSPRRRRKVQWYSPLWLGRNKRGEARMSSFQIVIWTYLVFAVTCYVLALNGQLIDINQGILALLGISGAGSLMARVASARQTERAEIIIAVAEHGKTEPVEVEPAWSDLIMNGTSFDMPRLQMLLFTVLAAGYVGITAIVTFQFPEVPQGLLWLMGISNGMYVFGKVAEPALADKLAGQDQERRVARRQREDQEGRIEVLKNRVETASQAVSETAKPVAPGADVDAEAVVRAAKMAQEELNALNLQLVDARAKLEEYKVVEKTKSDLYEATLLRLNKEMNRQAEAESQG